MKILGLILFPLFMFVGCVTQNVATKENVITKEEFLANENLFVKWYSDCINGVVPEQRLTCKNVRQAQTEQMYETSKHNDK